MWLWAELLMLNGIVCVCVLCALTITHRIVLLLLLLLWLPRLLHTHNCAIFIFMSSPFLRIVIIWLRSFLFGCFHTYIQYVYFTSKCLVVLFSAEYHSQRSSNYIEHSTNFKILFKIERIWASKHDCKYFKIIIVRYQLRFFLYD